MNRNRIISLLLAAAVAASLCFPGCKKNNVENEPESEEIVETIDILSPEESTGAMLKAQDILNTVGWDLWEAYEWSAGMTNSKEAGYDTDVPSGENHSEYFANWGFDNYSGNCYCMAATFLYMARLMGYDGHFIEGYIKLVDGSYNKHGWCELIINGETYVFDPNFTKETGKNGYQIQYGQSGTWKYTNWRIVDTIDDSLHPMSSDFDQGPVNKDYEPVETERDVDEVDENNYESSEIEEHNTAPVENSQIIEDEPTNDDIGGEEIISDSESFNGEGAWENETERDY